MGVVSLEIREFDPRMIFLKKFNDLSGVEVLILKTTIPSESYPKLYISLII